ncbi:MAG: hypothetical protein LBU06_10065, partial [Desulfovibrio sp.]|nr:hypothetical protein [Desulfovibrio sp.]
MALLYVGAWLLPAVRSWDAHRSGPIPVNMDDLARSGEGLEVGVIRPRPTIRQKGAEYALQPIRPAPPSGAPLPSETRQLPQGMRHLQS